MVLPEEGFCCSIPIRVINIVNIIIQRKIINMLLIHCKLNYEISRNISQNILCGVYSLTSYQIKLEPKILEKICAAVPVRAIMISKTQKKFYN